ncbi:MAG: hypothetical protein ACTSQI_07535 [Candidatus Helarchaeota archaeon]
MAKRHFSCIDVFIRCQKCRRPVQESLVTLDNYQRCDLNHIFCCECIEKEEWENCPICGLPLEFKVNKTFRDEFPI